MLAPGLECSWRFLDVRDSRMLADLQHRIEKSDDLPYRTSEEEIAELFSYSDEFFAIGGFIDGKLRVYGYIRLFDDEPVVASCRGGVDPKFRGIGFGRVLVEWHTQTATAALLAMGGESKQILFNVEEGHRVLEEYLLEYGYEWNRSYFDRRAALDEEPEFVEVDPFITIVPWDSVGEHKIDHALDLITRGEGGRGETYKWSGEDRAGFIPEWSFVAVSHAADREAIAGLVMASKYSQDWSVLGWREGTIDMLAVLPEFKDQTIAPALVSASMRAQKKAGMDAVLAGLSSLSSPSMMSVYDSLGFATVATSRVYTLAVTEQ